MGLIRYSCGHISGPNVSILVKFGVRVFHYVLLKYGDENAEMQNDNLMTSHFGSLYFTENWGKSAIMTFLECMKKETRSFTWEANIRVYIQKIQ